MSNPMEKASNTEATKAKLKLVASTMATASTDPSCTPGVGVVDEGPSCQRKGKQIMLEDCTEEERSPIIVNLAIARGTVRFRLLAVGVFLSLLTINSKQLVNYMKKVWKIRGVLETNQLADKRFVLEFSEEGDFEHVTRGGPWRYQNDDVLIRALKDGEDAETVPFETIPMWVQFAGVPFYLLSKELARELGSKLGHRISIDNNARGNICNKILRARVKIPVAQALRRWIPLKDGVTSEEILVSVFYERLPTFCLRCGVIGHQEAACDLPATIKRKRYNHNLGVQPTHIDDPRCWYLPETMEQNGRALHSLQWRNNPSYLPRKERPKQPQLAIVAHVAKEVAKLSVQDKDKEDNVNTNTEAPPTSLPDASNSTSLLDKDQKKASTDNTITHDANDKMPEKSTDALPLKKSSWKRVPRGGDEGNIIQYDTLTTREVFLRDPRDRPMLEEEDELLQPSAKKHFQVPSLEVCLGKENFKVLLEEEAHAAAKASALLDHDVNSISRESLDAHLGSIEAQPFVTVTGSRSEREISSSESGNQFKPVLQDKEAVEVVAGPEAQRGLNESLEATGHGAAGELSGADVSAWQEKC
uniref:Uncharacterized protein n=1 Tax=Avena sativa TaxID=4498 RepID=A0ACD5TWG8_AVESA